jgi:regulator of protease activity HflC (stomatin/prohibitin superfamily)
MVQFPWSLNENASPPIRRRHKLLRFALRHLPNIIITLMVTTLVGVVLLPRMIVTVQSGQVGVLWKRFNGIGIYCWCFVGRGTVLNPSELRQEGIHLIWPWDKLFTYDLRLRSTKETYNAISKDGVSLNATINIRFQLKNDSVAILHKFIGPGYIASVVRPEIGSWAREVIAQYTAEQVYSTSRQTIENEIRESAQKKLGDHLNRLVQPGASEQADPEQYKDKLKNSIDLIDTLVLGIELPKAIVGAINRKTEQFYQVQEYQFRIEKEVKESQRKQIEANGIAAFQKTVSEGISDSYLRWRGIEATLKLAESNNAKIVIIGSGKDGMPIILGNVDAPSPARPDARPAGGDTISKEKAPAAGQSMTPDKTDMKPRSEIPFSLSNIGSNASRIFDALRPTGTKTTSKTEAP